MRSFLAFLALIAFSFSAASQGVSDAESIRAQRIASHQAISAGDSAAFAASLSPDLVVVTGNGTQLAREAYVAAFATDFRNPHSVRFERVTDSVDMSSALPVAAEHGHWMGRVPGGPILLRGTYLAMWRKSPAGWQLRSELFVALECANAEACEAYRHAYAARK
jgi:ketosteroid isomerase-like protein